MAFMFIAWASFAQSVSGDAQATYDEILACIDWLQETGIDESYEARKTANAYLLQWVSRSPEVQVELHVDIVDLAQRNPDLLAIYIAGWAEFALSSQREYPSVEGHIKGMEAVVRFYKDNREGLNRDRFIEKLIKQEKKGTMYKALRKAWG